MSKKRKGFRKSSDKRHKPYNRASGRSSSSINVENLLLATIHNATKALTIAEIYELLAGKNHNKKEINKTVDTLLRGGLLRKTARNRFQMSKSCPLYQGSLTQHTKGFGFVEVSEQPPSAPQLLRDPFISHSHMANGVHGDEVLIRVLRIRRDKRPEAVIIDILTKGPDTLCGMLVARGNDFRVHPDDSRIPFVVQVEDAARLDAVDGQYVKVRYQRQSKPQRKVLGQIIEIIGEPDNIDTLMQLSIEQFNLPHLFSEEALAEAAKAEQFPNAQDERIDLRHLDHITIDGDKAKDFDDAINVAKTDHGYRLHVSIADVSHFVRQGSALDKEAFERGTSVYFPDRVIPMLPEILSNDLCSLVPGRDRLTVTAKLDFDSTGKLIKKEFFRSLICSKQRFTYDTVQQMCDDETSKTSTQHKDFSQQLRWAGELASLLTNYRKRRGSIDFDIQEAEIALTPEGEVDEINIAKRNSAHRLIEEFMIAANEAVASYLANRIKNPLYRIHESPDTNKLEEYLPFLKKAGLTLPPFENSPSWFAQVVQQVKNSRYEYIINNLLLRSLTQAQYSTEDTGHFGLASVSYCHFTSPIRRYPDLVIHRQLLETINPNNTPETSATSPVNTIEAGTILSKRERTAVEAERNIQTRLKISFMKDKVGQTFPAIISGVTENSLYIELDNLCISGTVPVEFLGDDYFIFDAKNYRLFGEISAQIYQIGDRVTARLEEVNRFRKKLIFTITDIPKSPQ